MGLDSFWVDLTLFATIRAAEIRRQQPRPEMRESEAGPSSSLADVEMVEEVQQETGYLARLAHASDLHLDPDAPDDPVIHIPKRLDFAYSRKLGVDAEAAIVKTLRKCGKPLNSPTLKVSELPLARLPHNGALLFW